MFDFNELFIFEMANNHQGNVQHGINIIKTYSTLAKKYHIKAAIKLQFRHYDTFIHPHSIQDTENKKVERFLSTRLSDKEQKMLVDTIKQEGLLCMVTPFDERSVDLINKLDVDIIKIGSPSLHDFKLFEKISITQKPIIVSSGGCDITQIDKLVSFFKNRHNDFALMHCVSKYPCENSDLDLHTLTQLKARYPTLPIGFSTHEEPSNFSTIGIAYGMGARLFEKHVGLPTETITLNKYSVNPDQADTWLSAFVEAKKMVGHTRIISHKEKQDLHLLYRGVFFNKDIAKGQIITDADIYFAFPLREGGILTGEFTSGTVADKNYTKDAYVPQSLASKQSSVLHEYIHKIKGVLNEKNIKIPHDSKIEISHHYGIENIFTYGCTIITIINGDEYCKKYIVMLKGQKHPSHYHIKKDETFFILAGSVNVLINDTTKKTLYETDILRIPRYTKHSFSANDEDVIFEEISTRHFNNDSIYSDITISSKDRDSRKTYLYNWII